MKLDLFNCSTLLTAKKKKSVVKLPGEIVWSQIRIQGCE